VPLPKNVKFVYPWVKRREKELDEVTKSFLHRFSSIILVEKNEDLVIQKELLTYAQAHEEQGFII